MQCVTQVGGAETTSDSNYDAHVAHFDVMIADMNECEIRSRLPMPLR
jgi:hypothetical protein